ncbi:MAG: DNA polymerase-3 subunit delta' [Flavobacteriales bacterium]|jgi:DNA polymerase-3 subunit delta'
MRFQDIIGNTPIKEKLVESVQSGRTSHAQLIVGKPGFGSLSLAIAYGQFLNCENPSEKDSCGTCASCIQYQKLAHPDLIFVFPTIGDSSKKKEAVSDVYLTEWRAFLSKHAYGNLSDWLEFLDVGNKQAKILKKESDNIVKKLSLKPFSNGYRVIILWEPELMNIDASNKLLKSIEEPPERTVFLLVSKDEKQVLQTIASRTQIITLQPISTDAIKGALVQNGQPEAEASQIAKLANGDYRKALQLVSTTGSQSFYQTEFVNWIRACFVADLLTLVPWTENIAKIGRERQKQFFQFASNLFRQALMQNYQALDLVDSDASIGSFKIEKFAPFVNNANVIKIMEELGKAEYHIERNANPKLVFLDLSIHMTRLLRAKEEA